jgi:tetratricopeptide (TPR) repeat protein/transcriptional regulator with XRE-family HTH domain
VTTTADVNRPTLAAKIDRLFRTVRSADGRELTYDYVAEQIAARGVTTISANYLYMLRRGIRDNPTKKHVEALAIFFGVSPAHFFDEIEPVADQEQQLLERPDVRKVASLAARLPAEVLNQVTRMLESADRIHTPPTGLPRVELDGDPGTEPPTAEPAAREPRDRATLELSYAQLAMEHGDTRAARSRLEALLRQGVENDDEVRLRLAQACERDGDLDAAIGALSVVHGRCIDGSSRLSVCMVSVMLSAYLLRAGDLNAAVTVGESGLRAAERAGLEGSTDYLRLGATLMGAHIELGNYALVSVLARRLVESVEATPSNLGQAAIFWNASVAAEARGELNSALDLAQNALQLVKDQDSHRDLPRLRMQVAWLLLRSDPNAAPEAGRLLDLCLPGLQSLGAREDLAEWNTLRAAVHLHGGQVESAEQNARQALRLVPPRRIRLTARAHVALGDVLRAQGQPKAALSSYETARSVLGVDPPGRLAAPVWRDLAERLRGLDDNAAVDAYARSLDAAGIRFTMIPCDPCTSPKLPRVTSGGTSTVDLSTDLDLAGPAPRQRLSVSRLRS